ncbi:MAG: flagellar biosynthesis protein FlhF [Firmicutes bacterium]|nr:flagellar biosynthesis protein FlhF [Bacillota bacterium]
MRVKRFVGNNLQEAILKVKTEMGKEAIILHTRKFKEGGFLGFFAREVVEVTAAVDDFPPPVSRPNSQPGEVSAAAAPVLSGQTKPQAVEFSQPEKRPVVTNEHSDSLVPTEELKEMKTVMYQLLEEMNHLKGGNLYPKLVQKAYHLLLNHEVEEKLAVKLINGILERAAPDELKDAKVIRFYLEEGIRQILRVPQPIVFKNGGKQQIVALVGPTGVGKTTTIAKLAASFSLLERKRVALVTIDTYRIAAVEQLKTYAQIIGIPIEVVFTPEALREAIAKHQDKDLIFLDTAGRSPKNAVQMSELNGFLHAGCPTDVFLVLSASTRYQDMLDVYNRFSAVPLTKLVFTKLDETNTFGPIINMVSRTKKRLSYITVGQNVPDDIEVADPQRIARLILGGMSG